MISKLKTLMFSIPFALLSLLILLSILWENISQQHGITVIDSVIFSIIFILFALPLYNLLLNYFSVSIQTDFTNEKKSLKDAQIKYNELVNYLTKLNYENAFKDITNELKKFNKYKFKIKELTYFR